MTSNWIERWNTNLDRRYFKWGDIVEVWDEAYWNRLGDAYGVLKVVEMLRGQKIGEKEYMLFDEELHCFFFFDNEEEFKTLGYDIDGED